MKKTKLLVCVGSSCHLKGSYHVLQKLKALVQDNKLEEKLELQASFCLGHCADGVCMKLGEELILHATPENVEEIFNTQILPTIA